MTAAPKRSPWQRLVVALAGLLGVALLSGCQLDVVTEVVVEPDGTGTVTVTATANAELVQRVPTIADDLVLTDVAEAGWVIEGPTPTDDGGLVLVLSHEFDGKDEATNLLRSLGSPFNDPVISRAQDGDRSTNTARANLGLPNGFATFADDDLVNAVGAVPFADEFEQSGVTPAEAFTAELILTAPGDVVDAETNAEILDDGRLRWVVPTDGTILEASARTEQAPTEGEAWARPVATIALIALIAWVAFMSLFIAYVAVARWRRARRYRRRALP